jgi:hypothetical protein
MRGLDPGISSSDKLFAKKMDCPVKPGNDAWRVRDHADWRY